MNNEEAGPLVYYEMKTNVHVILNTIEQWNLWEGEIYSEEEFANAGLNLKFLLEKGACERWKK